MRGINVGPARLRLEPVMGNRLRIIYPLFLLGLAVMAQDAKGEVQRFEGSVIVDITFSPASPLQAEDLAAALPFKKGEVLQSADVANAIDALFATGMFEDIVVEAERSGTGVILRFVTKTSRFIGGVSVEGSVSIPPNRGQLISSAQLTLGAPFEQEQISHAIDNLKRILESNGLYEAQVSPEAQQAGAQQVFITFTVKEGKRAKYEAPIVRGNTGLPDSTIVRATGWRVPIIHWWRRVTDARTRKGVQGVLKKYQSQDRLTTQVKLEKLDYDAERRRVQPSLQINPGPKIKVRAVEAKVSKRLLKRYVPIFQERAVDNDLLVEGKRNLRDYFQSQGYYDVDVDVRTLPPEHDLQTIEYVISRGARHKLAHVAINGAKYFSDKVIRERMFIHAATFNLRRGRYSEAFRRKDEENIKSLYLANGFRDVKVTITLESDYKGKQGADAVNVDIVEGPQWLVDALNVTGVAQVNRKELIARLASAPGQPFAEVNLASDRNQTLTYYYEHGFPKAAMKATWELGGAPNHVNVSYTIAEGSPEFVRQVIMSGLRTTRPSLVRKQVTLNAGDPLSPVAQTAIQQRLYNLGIFARVDTAIEDPDGKIQHKYVLYNFEEANRYTLAIGLGAQIARFGTPSATSLAAPAGSTGFSPEVSFDASRLNFLGIGHTVTLRGMYSSLEKRGSVTYLAPRFQNVEGRNITTTLLYEDSLNVRTFSSRREEASIQLSQKFSKSLTGLFRYSYRRVSVSNVIIPVLLVPQLLQPVRLSMLSANFAQDRRDNAADPHRGVYNTVDLGLAAKFFGSQRSFGRALVRNATYYKLTDTIVLARQTQFGVITPFAAPAGLTEQESVPLPERFFGGGADSLRAFPFNQAGPRDVGTPVAASGPASPPTGFPLGGNALFFNNVELRFPFIGANIQGVLFHDMGNIFSTLSDISLRFHQRNLQDFNYTVHAVGFGIRYRTPIGPIRLDLAYSINPPSFIGFSGTPAELLQCNPNTPGVCQGVKQNIGHFQFFFSIGQTF